MGRILRNVSGTSHHWQTNRTTTTSSVIRHAYLAMTAYSQYQLPSLLHLSLFLVEQEEDYILEKPKLAILEPYKVKPSWNLHFNAEDTMAQNSIQELSENEGYSLN